MANGKSVAILVAVLALAGLVVALKLALAQDLSGSNGDKQIITAVATESVTEYEPDPFEPERLRSSTVRVRRMAVVYSDGTIEVKQVP